MACDRLNVNVHWSRTFVSTEQFPQSKSFRTPRQGVKNRQKYPKNSLVNPTEKVQKKVIHNEEKKTMSHQTAFHERPKKLFQR